MLPTGVQAVLRGARTMVEGPEIEHVAQNTQLLVTENPRSETYTVDVTENPVTQIARDLVHAENQGANSNTYLLPTLGEVTLDEVANHESSLHPVASQSTSDGSLNTQLATQPLPQQIVEENGNCVIDIQVQTVPISAVSPKGKNMLIGEGSKNSPRILQRHKSMATANDSCTGDAMHLIDTTRQEINKEAHGPRFLVEPTRQEKKRVLLESTKMKRKQREAQVKGGKAGSEKPKASLTNKDGLVQIQVDFKHCSRIAEVTGFQPTQVIDTLNKDNEERAVVLIQTTDNNQIYVPEGCTVISDPHSEDKMGSDAE